MDEFGDSIKLAPKGLIDTAWTSIVGSAITVASASTLFITLVSMAIITRIVTSRSSRIQKGAVNPVPKIPYSIPFYKHAFSLLFNASFLESARDASHYGIFSVQVGQFSANVISDPDLVTAVMHQKEANVQFMPIAWRIMRNIFGVKSGRKRAAQWETAWSPLHSALVSSLMREPHVGKMVDRVLEKMERAIPSMISFTDNPIDQQPWERAADVSIYPSELPEVYLNLSKLMRHLLGEVSIPALMGDRFLEKYPNTLENMFTMDDAFMYLGAGVSRYFPVPKVIRAYMARRELQRSMADFDAALEMALDGMAPNSDTSSHIWDWGEMDDVSDLIVERSKIYKKHGFAIEDRCDLSLLWAFTVNSTLLVYWHIFYILSTSDLLPRILEEIAPYAITTPGLTIGAFSTAPTLKLSAESLVKSCPLFKSTYFETLRIVDHATSIRRVGNDITISPIPKSPASSSTSAPTSRPGSTPASTPSPSQTSAPTSFALPKSSYIIMPNSLHANDPSYFPSPETFIPERFMIPIEPTTEGVLKDTSSQTPTKPLFKADQLTTRPYGGGPTSCKGRLVAERECLALVAGVLMMWEIEPADPKKGWKLPGMKRKTAIAEPRVETRVKVRRRRV